MSMKELLGLNGALSKLKKGREYSGHYRYMVTVGDEAYFHDDEMVANRAAIYKGGKLWVLAQIGTTIYRMIHSYEKTTKPCENS